MLEEREQEFSFLIIRKGERRTLKLKSTQRSAVNQIRREFKNSDIYISFMGQWLAIRLNLLATINHKISKGYAQINAVQIISIKNCPYKEYMAFFNVFIVYSRK